MIENTIARRYAKALFDLAVEEGQMAEFQKSLRGFDTLCRENPELIQALSNRFFDKKARIKIVDELAARLSISELMTNFFKILVQKGRMDLLSVIVQSYTDLIYHMENKFKAVITTAKPLNDAIYEKLEGILSRMTGKKIVSIRKTKPEVIGGIAIEIDGKIFDSTIKSELDRFSLKLKASGQHGEGLHGKNT